MEQQKALSVQQPWSWCLANGFKTIENRDWRTKFRGEFYIHAGKKVDAVGYAWIKKEFPHIPLPPIKELMTGGIVGVATITDCVDDSDNPWFFGKHGFVIENAREVPFKPFKGALSFFKVSYP